MAIIEALFNFVNSSISAFFDIFTGKSEQVKETPVEDTSVDSTDIEEEIVSE